MGRGRAFYSLGHWWRWMIQLPKAQIQILEKLEGPKKAMALSLSSCASLNPRTLKVQQQNVSSSKSEGLEKVKNLVTRIGIPSRITSPHESLHVGNWVKFICGASFEDVADIRNLSLVYTLAGVDCIDCAAEASVVTAVNEGIEAARAIVPIRRPWIMVSVNDDEDPHFRKAEFDPNECPPDCSRPCEVVCPANAILGESTQGGVQAERCYGCGRCIPICPFDKIRAITYIRDVTTTAELLKRADVDAIEIHTSGRHVSAFQELWNGLGDSINHLKLVAVSIPDVKDLTIATMNTLYSIMESNLSCLNLWQLDGRPMSGDIGRGATRAAIALAQRLASARGKPQGFLQLAGGTNAHTVDGLKKEGLFQTATIAGISESERNPAAPESSGPQSALIGGVAFGGYARKVVGRVLASMQFQHTNVILLEDYPEHLLKALEESLALVTTVKSYSSTWKEKEFVLKI